MSTPEVRRCPLGGLRDERRGTVFPMTDYGYLSTTSVAMILVSVAMLTMIVALSLDAFGEPERSYTGVLFVSLGVIWTAAILVVVFIRLPI